MSEVAKQQWFLDVLKKEENGKKDGFNGKTWIPHKSPEGGAKTIGYGHKINNPIVTIGGKEWDLLSDEIPDNVIEALFLQDIAIKEKKASKEFTEFMPMGKDVRWNDLPIQYKVIMTEIAFNVGTLKDKSGKWGWKKLAKGMKENNHTTILSQLMRKYTPKGSDKAIPLTKRVKALKRAYKKQLGDSGVRVPSSAMMAFHEMFPNLDAINKPMRMRFLSKIIEDQKKEQGERDAQQLDFDVLMEEANERDRGVRRAREEEQRESDEATLQAEVTEATAVKPVDETKEVITEKLADVQYFMKPDGSVIKVNAAGQALD